jgi:hypothetical protein
MGSVRMVWTVAVSRRLLQIELLKLQVVRSLHR